MTRKLTEYADIIDLPHHVSTRHPQMSLHDRAAQFAPFAALTGHSDMIEEAARETEAMRELTETATVVLDRKLAMLAAHLDERPHVTLTRFVPDDSKAGGRYEETEVTVRALEPVTGALVGVDGMTYPLAGIIEMDAEIFSEYAEVDE